MERLKEIEFYQRENTPTVVCLGFFDCVHRGHNSLVQRANMLAKLAGAKSAVFTFSANPFAVLGRKDKEIFTFEERVYRLSQLGVDCVLKAFPDREFFCLTPEQFLDKLFENHNIVAVVAGSDYTFGSEARGNADMLKSYCKDKNCDCHILDMVEYAQGRKIASREIRKMVEAGEVEKINALLPLPYIVMGTVIGGRHQGGSIGSPTANIDIDSEKLALASGVYDTNVIIDGVRLRAVTNVGQHPTFDDYHYNIESYILHWNKNIYGKKIVVEFLSRLRDVIKFQSKEQLSLQIEKDVKRVLERR